MKNQEILRLLLQERAQRAMRVDKLKMIFECKKLGLSEATLYDLVNYQRGYVKTATAQKVYAATKAVLG
jgi:hypothetical protein